jgi:small subunit ribosomal protein S19e
MRQVYIRQGLGVGQLRMKYGGRNKRKGVHPEHFVKASGGLIRHIMKQFEGLGYLEKHTGAPRCALHCAHRALHQLIRGTSSRRYWVCLALWVTWC